MMSDPVFEVRRSRPHLLMQATFGMFIVALALANLVNLYRTGEAENGPLLTSVLFAFLMSAYVWNLAQQYRDREPQVVIGASGLLLPTALSDPVPWTQVWNVAPPGGARSRMRLDIDVAPEVYARMKLGQRFMGENIVRRKGPGGGLSIYTMGYEHNAREIAAAIRRYWPPADLGQQDDDED